MAKKTVELIMRVADATRDGIEKVKANVSQMRKDLNVGGEKGLLGSTEKQVAEMAKVAKVVGMVQMGVASVELGIAATTAATALWKGNTDDINAAYAGLDAQMQKLPMGLNSVYAIGQKIQTLWNDDKAAIEAINKETDQLNKKLEKQGNLLNQVKKIQAEASKGLADTSRQLLELRDGAKVETKLTLNEMDFAPKIKEVEDRLKDFKEKHKNLRLDEAGTKESETYKNLEAELKNLNEIRDLKAAAIQKQDEDEKKQKEKQRAEEIKRSIDAANQQHKAERDARQKNLDDFNKMNEESARKRQEINTELFNQTNAASKRSGALQIEVLRAIGKHREADKAQIMEAYEDQVLAAQESAAKIMENQAATAEQRAAAEELLSRSMREAETQRDFKLGKALTQSPETPGPLAMRESRFLTGASDQKQQEPQIKLLTELVAIGKKANEIEAQKLQMEKNTERLHLITR